MAEQKTDKSLSKARNDSGGQQDIEAHVDYGCKTLWNGQGEFLPRALEEMVKIAALTL